MSRITGRFALAGLALGVAASLFACVAGVGYGGGGAYGPGYVEPVGYDYGGWGATYLVGPARGGERRAAPPARNYRPAPASRSVPSIPNRSGGTERSRGH